MHEAWIDAAAWPTFLSQRRPGDGAAPHILGPGWFLLDVQAHKASADAELVEGGQLLALFIDPDIASPFGDKDQGSHGHEEDDD